MTSAMNIASLATLALVIVSTHAAAVHPLSRGCVLDGSGEPVCTYLDDSRKLGMELSPSVRFRSCTEDDQDCLNLSALDMTNDIRSRRGDGTNLRSGPRPMLDNALQWSRTQMRTSMRHQSPLPKLTCGVDVNRENVAWFSGMDTDAAVQCMDQWENSPDHLKNIVEAAAGDFVTIGIVSDGNEVYCTQTFSTGGDDTPGCEPLSDNSAGGGFNPSQPGGGMGSPTTPGPRPPQGPQQGFQGPQQGFQAPQQGFQAPQQGPFGQTQPTPRPRQFQEFNPFGQTGPQRPRPFGQPQRGTDGQSRGRRGPESRGPSGYGYSYGR